MRRIKFGLKNHRPRRGAGRCGALKTALAAAALALAVSGWSANALPAGPEKEAPASGTGEGKAVSAQAGAGAKEKDTPGSGRTAALPVRLAEIALAKETRQLIPAGEFLMGTSTGGFATDENPRHKVYLDAFYMDRYEITAARYKAFSDVTGRIFRVQPATSGPTYPIVNVDWSDAAAYCKWAGGRLPTEAEWEKAARGGADTAYSFGDDASKIDEYAWTSPNSGWQAHPPGQKKANQYGLYDMHGNVMEWVADWYDSFYYAGSRKKNPKGPVSGTKKVVRGGGWHYSFVIVPRSAFRFRDPPDFRLPYIGFRCAADL